MKSVLTASIAAAGLALIAAPASADDHGEMSMGETKLAKMLEGRVAGEPERCIRTIGGRGLRVIDGTAIVYRRGDTIWVNRTKNPAHLDDNDLLEIRRFSASQLCRMDQVSTHDRFVGHYTGNIFLTDFVPYRLADS